MTKGRHALMFILVFFIAYSPSAFSNQTLRISAPAVALSAPFLVAYAKGMFKDQGVDIKWKQTPSGKDALEAMIKLQDADMVLVAQTPFVFKSFINQDLVIISGIASSYSDIKIVVRKDRGINTFEDLVGKKVGLMKGSTGEAFFSLCLTEGLIGKGQTKIVDISIEDQVQALEDGVVDAIATWEPFAIRAQQQANAMVLERKKVYREDLYIVANKSWLEKNDRAAKKFLRAIIKAEQFIAQSPEEARKILTSYLKLDAPTLKTIWPSFEYHVFLDQAMLTNLEEEARWVREEQVRKSKTIPNYLNSIHTQLLKEEKPEAMSIFQ